MKIKTFCNSAYIDKRGIYWTSWIKKKYPKINFIHDKFSISKKNVLRGLHGDRKTWKLVSCVYGKVFFVIVNFEKKSEDYLKHKSFILSHKNRLQVLVPPNYLNGFVCLSNDCVFHYKLSYKGDYFDVKNQFSLKWNDKKLKIKWPKIKNLILSKRDK
jgi:dTDP-4-dehydrorhamnose 3,5-epimerase